MFIYAVKKVYKNIIVDIIYAVKKSIICKCIKIYKTILSHYKHIYKYMYYTYFILSNVIF